MGCAHATLPGLEPSPDEVLQGPRVPRSQVFQVHVGQAVTVTPPKTLLNGDFVALFSGV